MPALAATHLPSLERFRLLRKRLLAMVALLENLPPEILLAIAKYLDVKDVFTLRLTSKFLKIFTSSRTLWLALARKVAYRRQLALPPGHRLFGSSTKALASATIRASTLEWMLLAKDSPSLIHPHGAFKTVKVSDSGEFTTMMLIEGGRYLIVDREKTLTCWCIRSGQALAELDFGEEESQFYLTTVLVDNNGEETLVLGAHVCKSDEISVGEIPSGGRLAIFKLLLPGNSSPSQSKSTWRQTFSTPITMTVAGLLVDDNLVVLTGQSFETQNLCVFLVDHHTYHSAQIDTGTALPQYTSLDVFVSSTHLVLYHELEASVESIVYELQPLLELLQKEPRTTCIAPVTTRTSLFDEASKTTVPDFWDMFISPDLPNASRAGWDPVPVRVSRTFEDDIILLTSHTLDHVFSPSAESLPRHRQIHIIPDEVASNNESDTRLIWFMPGWTAYVENGGHWAPGLRFKFVFFPVWPEGGDDDSARVREIVVPDVVDLTKLVYVLFDMAWGTLLLLTSDATLYIFDLF